MCQHKVDVLARNNSDEKFQKVYIRSDKTHTEILIELNLRSLLDEISSRRQIDKDKTQVMHFRKKGELQTTFTFHFGSDICLCLV